MAIVEFQFSRGYKDGRLISETHVKFEKKQGRYYPVYIRTTIPRNVNREWDYDQYDIYSFWFDEILTDNFQKIRSGDIVDPKNPKCHKQKSYDPEFWLNTPLLNNHPLDSAVIIDLEMHEPLVDQFQINED
jgi:hypothetical protein